MDDTHRSSNETDEYRNARKKLLVAERELNEQVKRVAALRRELPLYKRTLLLLKYRRRP